MKKLIIKIIPHKKQRYPTSGDYWMDKKGVIQIRISNLGNKDFDWLVAMHELVELWLTRKRGISWRKITNFDKKFEKTNYYDEEPGDQKIAPYYKEHQIASRIERLLAKLAHIDWKKYEKSFDKLKYE